MIQDIVRIDLCVFLWDLCGCVCVCVYTLLLCTVVCMINCDGLDPCFFCSGLVAGQEGGLGSVLDLRFMFLVSGFLFP